jgi:hypothetical protein
MPPRCLLNECLVALVQEARCCVLCGAGGNGKLRRGSLDGQYVDLRMDLDTQGRTVASDKPVRLYEVSLERRRMCHLLYKPADQ